MGPEKVQDLNARDRESAVRAAEATKTNPHGGELLNFCRKKPDVQELIRAEILEVCDHGGTGANQYKSRDGNANSAKSKRQNDAAHVIARLIVTHITAVSLIFPVKEAIRLRVRRFPVGHESPIPTGREGMRMKILLATDESIASLLARVPAVRDPCDLDLLLFLHRHPRILLTSEELATFVGYDIQQIAKSLDRFREAGFLERTQNPMHAARLYLLKLDGPPRDDLRALLKWTSTRSGRRDVLQALGNNQDAGESKATLLLRIA